MLERRREHAIIEENLEREGREVPKVVKPRADRHIRRRFAAFG